MHKFKRRILRQNLRQKMSFGMVLSQENCFIGLKKTVIVVTPTPKFWRWRNYFYMICSSF
jgi:hypothetical protein